MKRRDWFFTYVKAYRRHLLLASVLGALGLGSSVGLMFTSGYLISSAALRPESILLLYVPIVAVRAFGISRAVLRYVERLVAHDLALSILAKMRSRFYRIIEPHALRFHTRYNAGEALGMMAGDMEHLQDLYVRTVIPAAAASLLYAGAVVAAGMVSGPLAWMIGPAIFVLWFVFPLLSYGALRRPSRHMQRWVRRMYRTLADALSGMGDLVAAGRQDDYLAVFSSLQKKKIDLERRMNTAGLLRDIAVQLVIALTVGLVILWSGNPAWHPGIPAVYFAAFVLATLSLADAFAPLSPAMEAIPAHRESLRRLADMEHTWGRADRPEQDPRHDGPSPVDVSTVEVVMDHVSFRYPGTTEWAVKDISLTIPQGKKIAILGKSGSGKSTMAHLLQGVFPPETGSVLVNGRPAHEWGDRMTEVLSVLNQNPHIFDTTVLENIRIGRPDAGPDEVRRAARLAQIETRILSLPAGYATRLYESGDRLSGGERRRIALARILLKDTPWIILDEPTAGLDPLTERRLLTTILAATEGKSLVLITHRLVGMERMDEILLIDEGRITDAGTHAELLERNPRYRAWFALDHPFVAAPRH